MRPRISNKVLLASTSLDEEKKLKVKVNKEQLFKKYYFVGWGNKEIPISEQLYYFLKNNNFKNNIIIK